MGGITRDGITFDYTKGPRREWPRIDSPAIISPKTCFPITLRRFPAASIFVESEYPSLRSIHSRWSALYVKYHMVMIIWWWLGEQAEKEPLNDFWEERRQALWPVLKHVFRLPSGNQPTAEDLEATRNWNSTFSSFDGNFYNFPDQLDIRAHRQRLKQDGALVIKRLSDQFPIQPDDPYVVIEDSEHPAFSSWHYGLALWRADAFCLSCGRSFEAL